MSESPVQAAVPPPATTADALRELRLLTACRCVEDWTKRGRHEPASGCVSEYREEVETLARAGSAAPAVPPDTDAAIRALAELVRLKDGPRDDQYEARKPAAWQAARDVLAAVPDPPSAPSEENG